MPISLGTAFLLGIGGFDAFAAIVTSQAGILPIDFAGHNAPLVIVRIIGMFIGLAYCRLFVGAVRQRMPPSAHR
jgi:hypothetical protein